MTAPVYAGSDSKKLEKIMDSIQADYDAAVKKLDKGQKDLEKVIGDSYSSYVKSSEKTAAWMNTLQDECAALYAKIEEDSITYYRTMVDEVDMSDYGEWDDAMDDLYDLVYDDILDDIYDTVSRIILSMMSGPMPVRSFILSGQIADPMCTATGQTLVPMPIICIPIFPAHSITGIIMLMRSSDRRLIRNWRK